MKKKCNGCLFSRKNQFNHVCGAENKPVHHAKCSLKLRILDWMFGWLQLTNLFTK